MEKEGNCVFSRRSSGPNVKMMVRMREEMIREAAEEKDLPTL